MSSTIAIAELHFLLFLIVLLLVSSIVSTPKCPVKFALLINKTPRVCASVSSARVSRATIWDLAVRKASRKSDVARLLIEMGWWPFKRKEKLLDEEPHMQGTRMWIQDLREVCERCYDDHDEGQRQVRLVRGEWTDSHSKGEVDDSLLEGLERRAIKLLQADGDEWLKWLDDEDFWKPGWRDEPREE